MQKITHYLKLFAIFMTMTLFSTYLHGVDIISNEKTTKVKSIDKAEDYEGEDVRHLVEMTGISEKTESYSFKIVDNNTTSGRDYNPNPTFKVLEPHNSDKVISFENSKVVVPSGVLKFNILIQTKTDNEPDLAEEYTIHLGDKSAIGLIRNEDP